MNPDTQSLIEKLKAASDGLLYMSESDFPFEVHAQDNQVMADTTAGEEVSLDWFFRNHIKDQDWHEDEQKKNVQRYKDFKAMIEQNLTDVKVLRSGEVEVNIRIMGKAPSGEQVAITTKAIET